MTEAFNKTYASRVLVWHLSGHQRSPSHDPRPPRTAQSILLLLACSFFAACSRNTQLTVVNKSPATLTHIVATGSGFSQSLGPLAPEAQQQIMIVPRGESGLKLTFDADGKHFAPQEEGYFEKGYKVSATVAPDFSVTIDATLPY